MPTLMRTESVPPMRDRSTLFPAEPVRRDVDTLFQAVSDGKVQPLRQLLQDGYDPNSRRNNASSTPALLHAVRSGHLNCAKLLINFGANVNHADTSGMSPFLVASDQGDMKLLALLLRKGADANAANKDGVAALMLAAQWGRDACLQFLIEACRYTTDEINRTDRQGRTALIYAAKQGCDNALRLLIRSGADVNVADKVSGFTALMHAIRQGHHSCAGILLGKKGVNIDALSSDTSDTAVSIALQQSLGNYSLVETLLRLGADVTLSRQGQGFLHEIVTRGERNMVRLMVINGCPPRDRVCSQECFKFNFPRTAISPLAAALLSGYSEIARYFIASEYFSEYDLLKLHTDTEFRQAVREGAKGKSSDVCALLEELLCFLPSYSESHPNRRDGVREIESPDKVALQLQNLSPLIYLCPLYWHDLPVFRPVLCEFCQCKECSGVGGTKPSVEVRSHYRGARRSEQGTLSLRRA